MVILLFLLQHQQSTPTVSVVGSEPCSRVYADTDTSPPSYDEATRYKNDTAPSYVSSREEPEKLPYAPVAAELPYPTDPTNPPPIIVATSYPPPTHTTLDPAYPPVIPPSARKFAKHAPV